jgi:hypothetical protein
MKPYSVLNRMPAENFLKPELFTTDWDSQKGGEEQYQKGLKIGRESRTVGIASTGTWYADGKDGSSTVSYEGIGYHAHTASLLKGFLDSGCRIVVDRYYPEAGPGKVIKEATVQAA